MANIDLNWLEHLEALFKLRYAMSTRDAGFTAVELARYSDLTPEAAADELGADYDIERVDGGWGS